LQCGEACRTAFGRAHSAGRCCSVNVSRVCRQKTSVFPIEPGYCVRSQNVEMPIFNPVISLDSDNERRSGCDAAMIEENITGTHCNVAKFLLNVISLSFTRRINFAVDSDFYTVMASLTHR